MPRTVAVNEMRDQLEGLAVAGARIGGGFSELTGASDWSSSRVERQFADKNNDLSEAHRILNSILRHFNLTYTDVFSPKIDEEGLRRAPLDERRDILGNMLCNFISSFRGDSRFPEVEESLQEARRLLGLKPGV